MELGERAYVKPKEGYRVVDPVTGFILPATGKEVVYSSFWHSRVQQGDCVIMSEPPPPVDKEVSAPDFKRAVRSSAKKETGGNE